MAQAEHRLLFSDEELAVLRRGFYQQAPTVAALLATTWEEPEGMESEIATATVVLIECLIQRISEVLQ